MTKTIYSKWLAINLRKRGFKIVRTEVNPNYPQFDCYVFEDSVELEHAITEETQERKRKRVPKNGTHNS